MHAHTERCITFHLVFPTNDQAPVKVRTNNHYYFRNWDEFQTSPFESTYDSIRILGDRTCQTKQNHVLRAIASNGYKKKLIYNTGIYHIQHVEYQAWMQINKASKLQPKPRMESSDLFLLDYLLKLSFQRPKLRYFPLKLCYDIWG